MRKYIILVFALFGTSWIQAQEGPIKVVFDVTSDKTAVHGATIRHVKYMSEEYPDSKFEVVMYSGAYDMVNRNKSTVASDMEKLAKRRNVSFVVCKATIDRHNITASDLVPGVTTVPNGIYEIFTKQKEGWGYIKEGQ
ncbi:MAG: DsrE family protein [Saonia sp.]